MAIYLDRIEESGIEQTETGLSATRSFFISDIPTATPAAVLYLALTFPGVPAMYDPHPAIPGAKVRKKRVVPKADTQCAVVCTSETATGPDPGAGGTPFIMTDDTGVHQEPCDHLPGRLGDAARGTPFRIGWRGVNAGELPIRDTITEMIDFPIRQ